MSPIDTSTHEYILPEHVVEGLTTFDTIQTSHYESDHVRLFRLVSHGYERYIISNRPVISVNDTIADLTHYYKADSNHDANYAEGEYLFSVPNHITTGTKHFYNRENRLFGRFKLSNIMTREGEDLLPGCFRTQTLIFFENGEYVNYYGPVLDSCTSEHQDGYEKVFDTTVSATVQHNPTGVGEYFVINKKIYFFSRDGNLLDLLTFKLEKNNTVVLVNDGGTSFYFDWMKN